ncbi:aminopeptidase P family protein [Clostridium perfringens]|uniref:M24 family metallopeptidase n=1 Tax=Clostridium perfringens TaxID=1502 RepID=A0AAW9HWV1_CLOPF|nr:aminopeptidase P family protein [Clostridium perfringens]MBI5995811.1 aminopeptidase P family protein [Clostridium perfringens]MBI6002013.1 aminopeptidase P family protein [Clostridium perfringens]MBI6060369.1 aminopeptidase P family protein [Clostridium perfringens]MBI6063486.1 aminopeptidase P family protein [Clostridium perfringens]MBI6066323.1 aminopeptidase P family protein [Clostridium perfringens]
MNNKIINFGNILINKNLDAILIKSKANKKYINALTGSGVKVLMTKDKIYQIMDGRYINEANNLKYNFENIVYEQGESYINILKKLLKLGSKIGVESKNTLFKDYINLKDIGLEIVLLEDELEFARSCKENDEIELIKKACEITDKVFDLALKEIKVGMSEMELSALIQYFSIKNGASSMAFDTIVASGERGAMPHGRPTERTFKFGEFITIDFGIVYKGYQSDMTRTVCIGKPSDEMIKIYNIVLKAQESGIKFIRRGLKGKEVDKHVRDIICSYGYGEYFTHGLGHGIGIGDGDFPILNKRSNTILEEGMVMSCEPGIYIEGVGGVRIEDDVLIENGIGVSLNKTSKELIILGEKI